MKPKAQDKSGRLELRGLTFPLFLFCSVQSACGSAWAVQSIESPIPLQTGSLSASQERDGENRKEPAQSVRVEEPTSIYILRDGEDLPTLLRRLGAPDFVLTPKGAAAGRVPNANQDRSSSTVPTAGVTSIEVVANVAEGSDTARVRIIFAVVSRASGPAKIALGLAGLYPRRARDLGTEEELSWESDSQGGWLLRVPAPGQRRVEVELDARVKIMEERRTLALPLPESVSTSVKLDLPYVVSEATAADGGPLVISDRVEGEGVAGSRIEAILPPTRLVEISWTKRLEPSEVPTPLLMAKGDIELNVGLRQLTARSTWTLQARRGEARSIRFQVDEADELESVEAEGRSLVASETEEESGRFREFEVALPQTLRKGDSLTLTINTRRVSESDAGSSEVDQDQSVFSFRGHIFKDFIDQSGLLTVAPLNEPLRIRTEPRSGLTKIDPGQLSDLTLRSRPLLSRVFHYSGQPFDLGLVVEKAKPRVITTSATSLFLDGMTAKLATWIDYRVIDGSLVELNVEVPSGLETLEVGPADKVESWSVEASGELGIGGAKLVVALRDALRESSSFRLELIGRMAATSGEGPSLPQEHSPLSVPVFVPLDGVFTGSRVAVWPGVSRRVSLPPGSAWMEDRTSLGPESLALGTPPPTLLGLPSEAVPSLLLNQDIPSHEVLLRQEDLPRRTLREVKLSARVDTNQIEFKQELTCTVVDGQLSDLELSVPRDLEGRWLLVRNPEVARQEPLGQAEDGSLLHRLHLVRPVVDGSLRIEIQAKLSPANLKSGKTGSVFLPWIDLASEEQIGPVRVEVTRGAGVEVLPIGDGWFPIEATPPTDSGMRIAAHSEGWAWVAPTLRKGADSASMPEVVLRPRTLLELPRLVVSRSWIRTTQESGGDRTTTAWYRVENHPGEMAFLLPEGTTLEQAYVDGQVVSEVERVERDGSFRISLPRGEPSTLVVGITYKEERGTGEVREAWHPPKLLGGRIQQTFWEVRLPSSHALLGCPDGWTDENRWYWAGYVWMRRPWKGAVELSAWLGGPTMRPEQLAPRASTELQGDHSYLFGRTGDPSGLRTIILSRALLVGLCSGTILAVGLAWMSWRPLPKGSVPAALLMAMVGLVFIDASTFFQAVQSSLLGLVLLAVAAVTQSAVDRRRGPVAGFRWSRSAGVSAASGSRPRLHSPSGSRSMLEDPPVGSDDPTAVRQRPIPASRPKMEGLEEPIGFDQAGEPSRGSTTRSHPTKPSTLGSDVLEISLSVGVSESSTSSSSTKLDGGDKPNPSGRSS